MPYEISVITAGHRLKNGVNGPTAMRYLFFLLLLTITVTPPFSAAEAARLTLRNGDTLSGTIAGATGLDVLQFRTPYGVINVPWEDVARLRNDNGQDIEIPAAEHDPAQEYRSPAERSRRYLESLAETPETAEMPAPEQQPEQQPERQDQQPEQEARTLWGADWSGRANFGAGLQSGNSDQSNINADAHLKAKWEATGQETIRARLDAEYNREKDEGELTIDNRAAKGALDFFMSEQWFINTNLGFKQDEISNIDLRTTIGVGIGHQAYERDDLNLQYIIGASYLRDKYENGDSEDDIAGKWSLDYDQKFYEDFIQIFHNHELLVPIDTTDAFLLDSATGLRVPLRKGLIGTAEIQFDWDNDPAPGATEEDTIYSLKLGYEW